MHKIYDDDGIKVKSSKSENIIAESRFTVWQWFYIHIHGLP